MLLVLIHKRSNHTNIQKDRKAGQHIQKEEKREPILLIRYPIENNFTSKNNN